MPPECLWDTVREHVAQGAESSHVSLLLWGRVSSPGPAPQQHAGLHEVVPDQESKVAPCAMLCLTAHQAEKHNRTCFLQLFVFSPRQYMYMVKRYGKSKEQPKKQDSVPLIPPLISTFLRQSFSTLLAISSGIFFHSSKNSLTQLLFYPFLILDTAP